MSKVTIVGAGLTGLCLSILLKKRGYDVTVVEKNTWPGGIFASKLEKKYSFNSGLEFYFPHSWLLSFFNEIGEDINQYLTFTQVKNKYKTYLESTNNLEPYSILTLNENLDNLRRIITHLEGNDEGLESFFRKLSPLADVFNYNFVANNDTDKFEKFLYKNGITGTLRDFISKYFKNPNTIAFFESFSLFFGDEADKLPAYYVFMLIDIIQKPLYAPESGFTEIAERLYFISSNLGTKFWFGQEIEKAIIEENKIKKLKIKDSENLLLQRSLNKENKFEIPFQDNYLSCDTIIHTGDYESFEKTVIKDPSFNNYDDKFWSKLEMTPSYSTFLIGLKEEIKELQMHCFIPGKTLIGDQLSYDSSIYFTTTKEDINNLPTMKILSFQQPNAVASEQDNDKLLLDCIRRISQATHINLSEYIAQYVKIDPADLKNQFLYFKKSPYGMRKNIKDPVDLLSPVNKKIKNLFYATNSNYPGGNGLLSVIRAKSISSWLVDEKNSG
jgi:phytoene desaturase